ncbi:MAG: hypothetical protein II996_03035, partial [Oscillospiraceae bacterium]|nr:hypothetical protein [Oscillospiraceae bacterium]
KVNTITSSAMLDSSASAPWAHSNKTFNINNSWQALYQDYMQFGATETNCGKNALVIKAELDRPAVYRPVLSYWKALHCGKVDVYMIPSAYADSRWAATWTAEEIVNDENLIEIATNVDMSATANATAATAYTGEPVELSEESYYIIYMISEVGKDETLNDRSYGQVDSLVLDYEGELYDEVDNPNIALATTTNVEGYTKIDVQGDIERGTEVTVTAAKIPGYTFRHWVRGTADKGDWVSADPVYNFTLVTNTFLTAVYTPDVAEGEKIVEFFNGNGEYITQETVVDGKVTLPAKNPEMTGFKFLRWIVAKNKEFENNDIIAPLTRVVAEFGDADATFSVNGTEGYKYDTLITKTSDTPVVWYRDGVRVGYGKEYNYRVWDTVGKITSAEGTAQPLVVLDKAVKTDGDGTTKAYMIEYDAGDKEIVEVGILFGDGTNMTVDSCMYKATSQKSGSDIHGQFTAKPANDSYANARGYMIYKDGTEYKVVYSD